MDKGTGAQRQSLADVEWLDSLPAAADRRGVLAGGAAVRRGVRGGAGTSRWSQCASGRAGAGFAGGVGGGGGPSSRCRGGAGPRHGGAVRGGRAGGRSVAGDLSGGAAAGRAAADTPGAVGGQGGGGGSPPGRRSRTRPTRSAACGMTPWRSRRLVGCGRLGRCWRWVPGLGLDGRWVARVAAA